MQKLQTYLYVFKNSFYNFDYYKEIATSRFKFSLKYLTFLLFLTSLISSLYLGISLFKVLPQVPGFVEEVKTITREIYPDELVLTMTDNVLSTNVNEPYYIALPEDYAKEIKEESGEEYNLIAIDTQASVEEYASYKSLILLTDRSMVTLDGQGNQNIERLEDATYTVYPYSGFEGTYVVDKQVWLYLIQKAEPYLDKIEPIVRYAAYFAVTLAPFVFVAFSLLNKLIYLAVITLLPLVICAVSGRKYTYKQLYKMGMVAITPAVVVQVFFTYTRIMTIPFLFTLIYLAYMIIVITKTNSKVVTNGNEQKAA